MEDPPSPPMEYGRLQEEEEEVRRREEAGVEKAFLKDKETSKEDTDPKRTWSPSSSSSSHSAER